MKTSNVITVQQKDLLQAIDIVSKTTLGQKSSMEHGTPIFSCILFHVKSCFVMEVTGSDFFMHTTASVQLHDNKGEYCKFNLYVGDIAPVLRRLDDQKLTIEVHDKKAVFHHSYGSFTLPFVETEGAMDLFFSRVDRLETRGSDYWFDIEAPFFRSMIARMKNYIEPDYLLPMLGGICIRRKAGKIDYVGCNAHRLLCISKADTECTFESTLLIPIKAVNILRRIIPSAGTVHIDYSETVCHVHTENGIDFWFEPTEGRYPDYNKVIPEGAKYICRIRRGLLLRTLDRFSFLCDYSEIISAKISEDKISFASKDKDFCIESAETLPCEYKDTSFTFGLKIPNFVPMLSGFRSKDILIHHTGNNAVGIILTPDAQTEDETVPALFMPCSLGSEE